MKILQKALPHIVALIVFVVVSLAFFSPQLEGYQLRAGDTMHWLGMAKEIADHRIIEEAEPLWTNSMFGGMPAYQISVSNKANVGRWVMTVLQVGIGGPAGVLIMAMLSMYLACVLWKVSPWLAIVAGLSFGLATINILYLGAGHNSKVSAVALMPGVVGGFLYAIRGKSFWAVIPFMLFLSAHIAANHLQMTYYLLLMLVLLGVAELVYSGMKRTLPQLSKQVLFLFAAAMLAVLPNVSSLATTYEYGKYSTRGESELTIESENQQESTVTSEGLSFEYMHQYSFAKGEVFSILFPNVKGGQSGSLGQYPELLEGQSPEVAQLLSNFPSYWGAQLFTGGAFYFGVVGLVLFLFAMVFLKDRAKWAFFAMAILAIILSWKEENGLSRFFFDAIPGYDKFRDTKMIFVTIQVMLPLLGFKWLHDFLKQEDRAAWRKPLGLASLAIVLLVGFMATNPGALFDFSAERDAQVVAAIENQLSSVPDGAQKNQFTTALIIAQEEAEGIRQEIFKSDGFRSLGIIVLTLIAIMLATFTAVPSAVAILLLGVVTVGDLWTVDRRYLTLEKNKGRYISFERTGDKFLPHAPNAEDLAILEQESMGIDGFEALSNEIYEGLLENYEPSNKASKENARKAGEFGALNLNSHYRVLNMQNPFNDSRTSYFHKSIGGYHGAKLKRYMEVIDFYLQEEIGAAAGMIQTYAGRSDSLLQRNFEQLGIINMLNTKYLVGYGVPIPNTQAAGAAWFATELALVEDANGAMLKLGEIDPTKVAILESADAERLGIDAVTSTTGSIELTSYKPNEIVYKSNSTQEALAVFSEIWYPAGWQAYIDNEEVDHAAVNYLLRGVKVPSGEHEVTFRFEPVTYASTKLLGIVASIIVLLLAAFGVWKQKDKLLIAKKA